MTYSAVSVGIFLFGISWHVENEIEGMSESDSMIRSWPNQRNAFSFTLNSKVSRFVFLCALDFAVILLMTCKIAYN